MRSEDYKQGYEEGKRAAAEECAEIAESYNDIRINANCAGTIAAAIRERFITAAKEGGNDKYS